MNRRDFVGSVAATAALTTRTRLGSREPRREPPQGGFALSEVSIAELQQQMTAGRTTARRLVDQYAGRIEELDRRGPHLNHVLEINPEARAIADQLDQERRAGRVRGPLHGVPILIKDNVATADAMETTAGSLALLGAKPPKDSTLARKLREAGAVILGKTNLSEWANFRSGRSSSGWSGRGGQCHNPYALDRTPSGSSSGSAVAAASSSCAAAVGTETSGSIISPSSACGCVGVKPTVGLVSRAGVIPISHSQDTAGPITRTVADAAALLTAIAGTDPADEATAEADRRKDDYTRALDPDGLRGARLGVLRGTNTDPKILALYDAAVAVLRERGAELVDPLTFQVQLMGGSDLLQYEFKSDIERYLAEWAPTASVHNLDDLIAFNRREAAREMPYFAQETFEAAAGKGPLTSPTVGFTPTTPHTEDGETIEPFVSVPTAAAHELADAATVEPELEPEGDRSSAYGLWHCPPRALQPLVERDERKLAHSLRFVLPRITAPASRSRRATVESRGGFAPRSASEPAVVSIWSAVATLSLTRIGIPCRGPSTRPARRSRSIWSAMARASGFTWRTWLRRGPRWSSAAMRAAY